MFFSQVSVWHKPLAGGDRAVALLNLGLFDAARYNLTVSAELIGFPNGAKMSVRDLWAKKDLGTFRDGNLWFNLESTSVTMLRISAVAP